MSLLVGLAHPTRSPFHPEWNQSTLARALSQFCVRMSLDDDKVTAEISSLAPTGEWKQRKLPSSTLSFLCCYYGDTNEIQGFSFVLYDLVRNVALLTGVFASSLHPVEHLVDAVRRFVQSVAVEQGHVKGPSATYAVGIRSGSRTQPSSSCINYILPAFTKFRMIDLDIATYASIPFLPDPQQGESYAMCVAVDLDTVTSSFQTGSPVYHKPFGPVTGLWLGKQTALDMLSTLQHNSLLPPVPTPKLEHLIRYQGGLPVFAEQVLWPETRPYVIFDVAENYERSLLRQVYDELLVPAFPMGDELENFEDIQGRIEEPEHPFTDERYEETHVFLAMSKNLEMMGCCLYEYWSDPNSCLLTYLSVSDKCRGIGLAATFCRLTELGADQCAFRCNHAEGCDAYFLETNSIAVPKEEDVMDPVKRHRFFQHVGFQCLDFDYVQPALAADKEKCSTLLLLVYTGSDGRARVPYVPIALTEQRHTWQQSLAKQEAVDRNRKNEVLVPALPCPLVKRFMYIFWLTTHPEVLGDFTQDSDYQHMMHQLSVSPYISLTSMPWLRGIPPSPTSKL